MVVSASLPRQLIKKARHFYRAWFNVVAIHHAAHDKRGLRNSVLRKTMRGRDVLLVKRFDREKTDQGYLRARMISALTLLRTEDNRHT